MHIIFLILTAVYFLIGSYILFYSFYWCYLSIMSCSYAYKRKSSKRKESNHITIDNLLILFPAYQPDMQLVEAVKAAKNMNSNNPFQILVLLQNDKHNIKPLLKKLQVNIIEKDFKNALGNPYHEALRFCAKEAKQLNMSHILLLDKDNVCDENCLNNLKLYGNPLADVWQGKRLGLNKNNTTATYDTISEKLNDSLLREAKRTQNLPPELSGSAILFKIDAFYTATHNLDSRAPGMDKNLLIQLILANFKIDYVPEAQVFEEKTADESVLKKQRTRWFGNQYFNAFYWGSALLKKHTITSIDYLITLYRPPRSLQLVMLPVFSILEIVLLNSFLFSLSMCLTLTGIFVFITKEKIWSQAFSIIFKLPKMAYNNLLSAIIGSSKNQQGKFISTERITNEINDAA